MRFAVSGPDYHPENLKFNKTQQELQIDPNAFGLIQIASDWFERLRMPCEMGRIQMDFKQKRELICIIARMRVGQDKQSL